MSAWNCVLCPNCNLIGLKCQQLDIDKARDSYGKVSPEKYLALLFKSRLPIDQEKTLREDYNLGFTNNTEHNVKFHVSYTLHCGKCSFSYQFKHEGLINLNG